LTYEANSGDVRTGTVTIAGQTFTATQAAVPPPPPPPPPPCTFSISPDRQLVDVDGATIPVTVTASQPTCDWTANSDVPWVTIVSGAPGIGNGTVQLSVDRNRSDGRTGTVTIAGKVFAVFQRGAGE
jgi:hypothetical protein